MNMKFRKALAASTLTLALGTLAVGFTGVAAASAEGERPTVASGNVGDTQTSASTTTLPWCGWYINGLSSNIELSGDATYEGREVTLSGSSESTVEAFVNGSSMYSGTSTNCSWYAASNKQSATLTVALAQGSATSFVATTSRLDSTDTSMNFDLTSDNKLAITATPEADCSENSFTVVSDASIYLDHTSSTPVRSATSQSAINTTNKCSWTMNYETKIPAGKNPKYGNLTYNYTGPTLVTSLEVADAVAPTP